MAILSRTKGIFSQMLSDIRKITFITNIIVQTIFFIYYIFTICNSVNNIVFLITYSVLLLIATITFITYLTVHIRKIKKPKYFYRLLRVVKYFTNGIMLFLNIYEMIRYGISDLNKIILVISAISLIAQIVIELVRLFVEKYVRLVTTSLEMDLGILGKLGSLKEVKGNFFKLIDLPLEVIANKIDHKEPQLSEDEIYINEVAEKYAEQAKIKKDQKKEETKKRSDEKARREKKKIVEHWGVIKNYILKKKPKQDDEKAS